MLHTIESVMLCAFDLIIYYKIFNTNTFIRIDTNLLLRRDNLNERDAMQASFNIMRFVFRAALIDILDVPSAKRS